MPPRGDGDQDGAARPSAGINSQELARLLAQKRADEKLSIRQAAASAGVSFSTLSRVESGSQPDLATFLSLCAWLGFPPAHFYVPLTTRRDIPTVEKVVSHLSSDPRLSTEAAKRIASVVRDLYEALAKEPVSQPALALHLRAASVMRPGVPERLSSILSDMFSALERGAGTDA